MKRNKFSLSQYKLLTCNMGQLVPCSVTEVLPGDSILGHTSMLLRCTPLATPPMHPVQARVHHWFVPTRLLWDGWEDFITGGQDGEGGSSGAYPTITSTAGTGYAVGSLPDYLGIPTSIPDLEYSALPVRAYNKIFNEFYRDQDMISTPVSEDSIALQRIAWEKDYFTSSRPWSQRGPEVTLPLGSTAEVIAPTGIGSPAQIRIASTDGTLNSQSLETSAAGVMRGNPGGANVYLDPNGSLFADLSGATAASVNTIREAFAMQRYQEARARYGARYTEYLRYLNVVPGDARLQRPEYLGGGKQTISFSEVLQTSNDGTNGEVGELFGHGISALRTRSFLKYFPEHGYVVSLISVRPKTIYADGLFKHWNRRTKEDYWQKELQHIGQQEIYNKEVYAQGTTADDDVFGWQDRYDDYRRSPSSIAGEFRTIYNDWHFARMFASLPTLNQDFTDCDPSVLPFADQTNNQLLIMANNSLRSRRLVAREQQNHIY